MDSQKPVRSDLKIIIIGTSGTGKTSFVNKWTKKIFCENYKPTIVSEFGFKIVEIKGNSYRVQLWDIGGQDTSGSMTKIFAKDSHGCIILCEVGKIDTLEDTKKWKKSVDDSATFVDGGPIPCLLIQNKIDLITDNEEREQIKLKTKLFCDENNFANSFVSSVKEDINIDESMTFLVESIIDRLEAYAAKGNDFFNNPNNRETIKLQEENHKRNSVAEKKCCK